MPRDHRTSKEDFPLAEAQRLYQQLQSYQKVANAIGWSFSQTRRNLQATVASEPSIIVDVPASTVELSPTDNGNLPAIQTPAHPDAPERISAWPVHSDASALDDLTSRLATLEAFVAAMQQAQQRITVIPVHSDAFERISEALAQLESRLQVVEASQQRSALPAHQNAPAQRSAPERTEPPQWVSRGMHVSVDMLAAIDTYATQRRLEKRMALDELLRIAFAQVEGQVSDA